MSDAADAIKVETTSAGDARVVNVQGEVDLRNSPKLRDLLLKAANEISGPFLIDLTGVEYMDSSGVGTMVFVKREMDRRKRQMVLIGLQPRVRSVFEITHLDKFFVIAPTIDEVPQP